MMAQRSRTLMIRKEKLDSIGVVMLTSLTVMLALNQVVIKLTNGGFQPVFGAGLRSAGALIVLLVWMWLRRINLGSMARPVVIAGLVAGAVFATEFICLFLALDMTTVSRATIIFYSMPLFLTIAVHFLLPDERLTPVKVLGLVLALSGVIWVLFDRSNGVGSLLGDLLALGGALLWVAIALLMRMSPLAHEKSEVQLLWQLAVSTVILLAVAPLFGPLIRDVTLIHVLGIVYQIIAIASFGFLAWFVLLKIYPATSVVSFSFLSPVLSVAFSWLILDEVIGPEVIGGLVLVVSGLFLINRKPATR